MQQFLVNLNKIVDIEHCLYQLLRKSNILNSNLFMFVKNIQLLKEQRDNKIGLIRKKD